VSRTYRSPCACPICAIRAALPLSRSPGRPTVALYRGTHTRASARHRIPEPRATLPGPRRRLAAIVSEHRALRKKPAHSAAARHLTISRLNERRDGEAESSSFPPFLVSPDCEGDASSDSERQGGKSESCLIVLAEEIFDAGIDPGVGGHGISHAQVKLLVARRKVAIWKKQCISEEAVFQKGAVVAPADEVAAERGVEPLAVVPQNEISRVGRLKEWPRSLQRRESTDGNVRELGIDCGLSESLGSDGIEVRVGTLEDLDRVPGRSSIRIQFPKRGWMRRSRRLRTAQPPLRREALRSKTSSG